MHPVRSQRTYATEAEKSEFRIGACSKLCSGHKNARVPKVIDHSCSLHLKSKRIIQAQGKNTVISLGTINIGRNDGCPRAVVDLMAVVDQWTAVGLDFFFF